MRKPMLWTIALSALSGGALLAQDITGTWQGTLQAPQRELRTVIKITKDGNTLRGSLYSIDQGGQPTAINPITVNGPAVKLTIPALGATYDGKFEPDGNSITGTVTQGPNPLPLNLKRATPETAWSIPEPPPPPKPMAAAANPEFAVATIKPSNPDAPGKAFRVNGRNFSTLNTTLNDMITFAYGIHAKQIVDGPSWMESEKFDIAAQPDGEGQPSGEQWRVMLQKLLRERFQLEFHRDKRELSVYAITVGRSGPKLTKSESQENLPSLFFRGLGNLPARNATMTDLANLMQSAVLDRPVINQTGIEGRYDFLLDWTPDEFQFSGLGARPPAPGKDATKPDLFAAFQEQLGLKIETTKAPAEVFVIERVTRPSEN
jgi:uncharacterized protein (TIGR03435 family)